MEFFKEMKAFKEWVLLNEISTSAIALWYTLMSINNSVGWKSRFNVPNSYVEQLTGLSKQGVVNARNTLIESKLIVYEKGKKGKAPNYGMVSLVNSVDPSLDQSVYPSVYESLTIPRQRHRQERGEERNAESPIKLFEKNIGKLSPIAGEELSKWRKQMGDDLICAAIKLAAKNGARSFRYLEIILEEWVEHNIQNVDEALAHQQARANKIHKTIPFPRKEQHDYKELFDEIRREG